MKPEKKEVILRWLDSNSVISLCEAKKSAKSVRFEEGLLRGEKHKMRPKAAKTGAQKVVESLERQGVQYVFGIPGAKIDKVFDALASSSIQTVVCRHEQNAAFIAGGIGRLTGRAGVAIATSGPGVSTGIRRSPAPACSIAVHQANETRLIATKRDAKQYAIRRCHSS